jgi:ATP-dependent Clp protease protease subunit
MQMVDAPVYTYAVGMTASMATVLLAAGAAGHRYSLPHATVHQHPSSSGMRGYTPDVQIALREQERVQTQIFHLLGKHTGHTWQEVERDFTRDRYMHSVEAKAYGIVDHILGESSNVIHRLADGTMGTLAMTNAGLLVEHTNGTQHS